MKRLAAKIDANHNEIVDALRQAGCSVQSLAALGDGVPDLLVARCGVNLLMEVKNPELPPSKQRLTEDEHEWHCKWKAQIYIVKTVDEALTVVNQSVGGRRARS